MTRGKDDFSAYEKKNTLQYTGTLCLRTVTKTHHQKKSGDVWKPCIRNPAAYLLCSSKSPFSL